MREKLARLFDEFGLALRGLLLATRKKCFWFPFIVTFVIFGTLINLLSNGFSSFSLIFANLKSGEILGALNILKTAFLGIFGVNKSFSDWALNFVLILFQSILVALVFFVIKNQPNKKKDKSSDSGLESSAIVAGLAVLGSGCPTCGTTLLAPILGTLASGATGAVSFAGKLSMILNILAIILAIFVFRKLGLTTYAIIKSEKYMKNKTKENEKDN